MSKRIIPRLLIAIFLANLLGITAACNTIEGAGKDIQTGGEKIRHEANEYR